jgi:NADH:ubiquinone reductase (H+-translocating)
VTVVEPAPEWVERTRLHQVAAGDAAVKRWSLAGLFRDTEVRAVDGTVTGIDPEGGEVTVGTGAGTSLLPFDRLVYALGSTADTGFVPGAREHAFVLDSTSTAEDLRCTLDSAASSGASGGRVAVVGGGLTGIEASTEIAETYPNLSVMLLSSGEVGGGLSARGREYLLKAMGRHGVELRERTRIEAVDRGALRTADGEEVPADVVVWAAGFAVPDLARRSGLAIDGLGRVLVDASLRSISHPNVFAAGDSAWPVESVGSGPVRPSAYTATIIIGAHAGGNVARDLAGKPTKPLRFGYVIQSISLGPKDGLVQFTDGYDRPYGWVVTGRLAARIKDAMERFAVVGPLRLERLVPGAFAWRPAPRARGGPIGHA